MAGPGVKTTLIDFSDLSGGKNSVSPPHTIPSNQCADTLNLIHEKNGQSRAPGYLGVTESKLFPDAVCLGLFNYLHDDGDTTIIAVSNGKLYSVNTSSWAKTEIGTFTGSGRAYAVNAAGNLWICNGTSFKKVEDDLSVYNVQIAAPTDGTAAYDSGGSLDDGVYGVYVAYAREDASGRYLYSLPQSLGDVTLGSGNNTIDVEVTESTDPQVNKIVVFMTDADGTVPYYYGEVDTPTVTTPDATITISSTADRNANILMSTVSAANQILPITPDGIFYFDDRLFVWDAGTKTVYWSLGTDINPFDLSRYLAENYRTMPYVIDSVFSIGENLYFNSIGNGISVIPSGDMAASMTQVSREFWYKACTTAIGKSYISYVKGMALGLTNDGFRFFDGDNFSEDVSFDISPDIDKIYLTSSTVQPCAIVYRRSGKRTEYRFSYNNTEYGGNRCNDQRILNIDYYFDVSNPMKTWECWENGFEFSIINGTDIYSVQNGSADAQMIREYRSNDAYCYNRIGTFMSSEEFVKQVYIRYRTVIGDLDSYIFTGPPYAFATSNGDLSGNVIIFDDSEKKYSFSIKGQNAALAVLPSQASGLGLALPFVMNAQYPVASSDPVPIQCRGKAISMEISQTNDDPDFFLYKLQLPRAFTVSNLRT